MEFTLQDLAILAILIFCCFLLGMVLTTRPSAKPLRPNQYLPPPSLENMGWMKLPLLAQPFDETGTVPFCANLECGIPLENPVHVVRMLTPIGQEIDRAFCEECNARILEERRCNWCNV